MLHLKGLAKVISPLVAILAGSFISVAAKGLNGKVGSVPRTVFRGERNTTDPSAKLPGRCGAGRLSAPGLLWTRDGQRTVAD